MSDITLFIANSLDGYISDSDGGVDWLFTDADYGFTPFYRTVDILVMGRRTWRQLLTFGDWPYEGKTTWVFSSEPPDKRQPNVRFFNGDPADWKQKHLQDDHKHCWLVGGGELFYSFFQSGIVDHLVLSIHPIVLGNGIPMFQTGLSPTRLELKESNTFSSGLVQLHYDVGKSIN